MLHSFPRYHHPVPHQPTPSLSHQSHPSQPPAHHFSYLTTPTHTTSHPQIHPAQSGGAWGGFAPPVGVPRGRSPRGSRRLPHFPTHKHTSYHLLSTTSIHRSPSKYPSFTLFFHHFFSPIHPSQPPPPPPFFQTPNPAPHYYSNALISTRIVYFCPKFYPHLPSPYSNPCLHLYNQASLSSKISLLAQSFFSLFPYLCVNTKPNCAY